MTLPVNTIICGDCLDVMREIPAGSIDMVMTDPPYGTTACKWDAIIPLEPMWEQLKRIIKPNGAIVMTASQPFTTTLIASNMKMFKYCWYWDKGIGTGFLNAKKQPLRSIEDACVFYSSPPTYNPQMRKGKPYSSTYTNKNLGSECYGSAKYVEVNKTYTDRYPLTKIEFKRDSGKNHPTQKPVALMEYLIKTYTNEGEVVLDFDMGSGSTGVACRNLGRRFIGIESDEEYFEIAKKRIGGGSLR